MPAPAPLNPEDRAALERVQAEIGPAPLAQRLRVSRETLRRALGGEPLSTAVRSTISDSHAVRSERKRVVLASGSRPGPLVTPVANAFRRAYLMHGTYGMAVRLGLAPDVVRRAIEGGSVLPSVAERIAESMWVRPYLKPAGEAHPAPVHEGATA